MPSQDEMLRYIHKKDPKTLNKRYTPKQLEAAFKALGGGQKKATPAPAPAPAAPMAPVAAPVPTNVNPMPSPTTPGTTEQRPGEGPLPGQGMLPSQLPSVSQARLGEIATNAAAMNLEGTQLGTGFTPNLTDRYSQGDVEADRQKMYDYALGYLTKDFDKNKGRDQEELMQSLYNRGIAFSADPNSRYQQELAMHNKRYDDLRSDAEARALLSSGQEMERLYGINETVRGNQLGEQVGIRNQQLGEVAGLSGIDAMARELALKRQQLQIQKQALNRGGGAPPPQEEPSPFNNTTPPGL